MILPIVTQKANNSSSLSMSDSTALFDGYFGRHSMVVVPSGGIWSLDDCFGVQSQQGSLALWNLNLSNSTSLANLVGQTVSSYMQTSLQTALLTQFTTPFNSFIVAFNGYDANQTRSIGDFLDFGTRSLNLTSQTYSLCLQSDIMASGKYLTSHNGWRKSNRSNFHFVFLALRTNPRVVDFTGVSDTCSSPSTFSMVVNGISR